MNKYIIIDYEMYIKNKVLDESDVNVFELTNEEFGWFMEAQDPKKPDIIIQVSKKLKRLI